MKPLVIYHDNCADGFGAAFAAWLKLGDGAEFLPMQYGKMDLKPGESFDPLKNYHTGHLFHPNQLVDREVYILDFSFSRETTNWLFTTAKRVVWLDHHKTAFEMWCRSWAPKMKYSKTDDGHYVELDDERSGALIAWEYFHPGTEVPMLIQHIDDYDRWQFKMKDTKAFQKALWSYAPWSFDQWRDLLAMTGGNIQDYESFILEGDAILRAHEQNVQSVVKGSAILCTMYDLSDELIGRGRAANCLPHLASDVGHELANQSGTYGLLWHVGKDGKAKCSLRSNSDYDVSAIAKAFGGGGHRNAPGFEVPIGTLLDWLKP